MTLRESYDYACEAGCATHLGIDHPNGFYEDRIQGDRKGTTSFGGGRNEKVVDFECSPTLHPQDGGSPMSSKGGHWVMKYPPGT